MAAGLYSDAAQIVHEIADRQPLSDDFRCVFLSTWIDYDYAFWNKDRREGNVGCYCNVALGGVVGDVLVSDISPTFDAYRRQESVSEWQGETLVRDQHRLQRKALGGAEANILHVSWCCVGIEP